MFVVALLVLAVEGVLLVRYYDRYYGSGADPGPVPGAAPGGAAPTAEGTSLGETTAPDGASIKGIDDAESTDPDKRTDNNEVSFVHRATDGNSRGDYTILSDPLTDGNPDAVVLAEPSGSYERNIGVWYVPGENKWAIFNQDLAAIPAGSAFDVVVSPPEEGVVHRAAQEDTVGNATYLDDSLLNGNPDAEVSVTPNWNPGGGGRGPYNDHPVGVLYDGDVGRWFVYNEDSARMPGGAAFNVAVSGAEPAG